MKEIESYKEKIENQTIDRLNIIETKNNDICLIELELSSGDKVEFAQNEGNITIVLKSARELEIGRIQNELNKMKSGDTRNFTLKAIDADFLRNLASQKAEELGHSDPLNVVKMNGSNCVVDLTDNYI